MQEQANNPHKGGELIHLPSPTAWPMVLALGISLVVAGLITHVSLTVLGVVLTIYAAAGWFVNVLPHEKIEHIHVTATALEQSVAAAVEPAAPATPHLSERTYSFISGVEAGIAGGLAMALVAVLFSLVRFHSLWYATNLMAASSFLSWTDASDTFLAGFHLEGLLVGLGIHTLVSLLVGLLYASIMPIFPRLALVTGGIFTPLVWTALAWSVMNSVTPVLGARVDWVWFIGSQIAYGVVAVLVIGLRVRLRSAAFQSLPFDLRAGIHSNEEQASSNKEVQG